MPRSWWWRRPGTRATIWCVASSARRARASVSCAPRSPVWPRSWRRPSLARDGRVPVTDLGFVAVTARAVHRLHAANAFEYYGPVADRPGFPPAGARTLGELAMNGVEAGALRRLPHGGPDLARLAEAVAKELSGDGLADRAAVITTATAVVRGDDAPPPVGRPLLLLDVPVGSGAEETFIAALVARAPLVLATAAAGDEVAIARLARALGTEPERGDVAATGSLAALQRHLFEPTAPPESALDEGVRLMAWPGEARECVEIARGIQEEAARGVPFDRMAVLLHAPADYMAHLEEAFARADIPFAFSRGTIRPHPAGRALLALLALRGRRPLGPPLRRVPVARPGARPRALRVRSRRRLDAARARPRAAAARSGATARDGRAWSRIPMPSPWWRARCARRRAGSGCWSTRR